MDARKIRNVVRTSHGRLCGGESRRFRTRLTARIISFRTGPRIARESRPRLLFFSPFPAPFRYPFDFGGRKAWTRGVGGSRFACAKRRAVPPRFYLFAIMARLDFISRNESRLSADSTAERLDWRLSLFQCDVSRVSRHKPPPPTVTATAWREKKRPEESVAFRGGRRTLDYHEIMEISTNLCEAAMCLYFSDFYVAHFQFQFFNLRFYDKINR